MLDVTPDVPAHANGPAADDDLARTAARILIPVVDAFEEDVGDRPRLAELVEALGWAVPSGEPCLEALGLFADTFPSPRAAALGTKATVPYVVHTDEQQLVNGVWKVIGHEESLMALFPEPEIYSRPEPQRIRSRVARIRGGRDC